MEMITVVSYIWNLSGRALFELQHFIGDLSFEAPVLPVALGPFSPDQLEQVLKGLLAYGLDGDVVVREPGRPELGADEAIARLRASDANLGEVPIETREHPLCWILITREPGAGFLVDKQSGAVFPRRLGDLRSKI